MYMQSGGFAVKNQGGFHHRHRSQVRPESPSNRPAAGPPTGVLLDLEGTVLDSHGYPLPGAIAAIAVLTAAGVPVAFVSNQTAKSREQLADQLRSRGFTVGDQDVLTTSSLTADLLRERYPGARVALYADRVPFAGEGFTLVDQDPDVVVLAGAGAWLCHDALNSIVRQVGAGADLVAMHSNVTWMAGDGLALDTGALLPGIETATGRQAEVVGKPSPAFFKRALAAKAITASGAVMVGDDIESDVLAAQRLGLTGVLVRTGKYRGDRGPGGRGEAADHVIDSIADLTALLLGGAVR